MDQNSKRSTWHNQSGHFPWTSEDNSDCYSDAGKKSDQYNPKISSNRYIKKPQSSILNRVQDDFLGIPQRREWKRLRNTVYTSWK